MIYKTARLYCCCGATVNATSEQLENNPTAMGLYCCCGATVNATAPAGIIKLVEIEFWRVHSGDGHCPSDSKTAARERKRSDKIIEEAQNEI